MNTKRKPRKRVVKPVEPFVKLERSTAELIASCKKGREAWAAFALTLTRRDLVR